MLGKKNYCQKQIAIVMSVLMAVAMVFSVVTTTFASDTVTEERVVPSFRTMNTAIIKGSENVPEVSVKTFLMNIWKNTGINQLINGEPEATDGGHHATVDPFAGKQAPGWQKLMMIAIGFLIIYLGAAKGFEPLLLIPIGFGTVLVNIPGAGMYNEGTGMLRIIYDAGVGNEFFPMLIFMGIGAMTDSPRKDHQFEYIKFKTSSQ